MHLNTSTTCFKGPPGRKIGFRNPGPGYWVYVLLNLVRHQCIYIYIYIHQTFRNLRPPQNGDGVGSRSGGLKVLADLGFVVGY